MLLGKRHREIRNITNHQRNGNQTRTRYQEIVAVDRDYSHESKRHLLFGRKAMTNLNNVLKTRDNTLPTVFTVRLVQALVFPGVMYGCQSWTIKKAEH